jgi:hypothetical protein
LPEDYSARRSNKQLPVTIPQLPDTDIFNAAVANMKTKTERFPT